MDLRRLMVAPDVALIGALRIIDDGLQAIAIVVDDAEVVVGTVTDGDIRRALLSGASLDDPVRDVMTRDFVRTGPEGDRNQVLDLMRARGVVHVPVLDEAGRFLGMHTLREMVGGSSRPNWALIMAGGRGSRMAPLTDEVPKPMLSVAGRPILERLVLHVVGTGIERVFIAVNHLAEIIESHFGDGSMFGCSIEYLRETAPLGTAGALSLIPTPAVEPILVLNGDLVTQADLGALLDDHVTGGYAMTVGLRAHTVDIPYGVVATRNGRVLSIEEKPTLHMSVNAGLYAVSPEVATRVGRDQATDMTDLVADCLRAGLGVGAHHVTDEWIDVGHRDDLARARGRT